MDKFYTNIDIAKFCSDSIVGEYDTIIEPSVGDGSFASLFEDIISIDLYPDKPGIIKMDYLDYYPEMMSGDILVVGNPPFGKNSSLAVKFFNHSAKFAKTIAFILPRTFRKPSVINRLSYNFTMSYEWLLPVNSFHLPDGTPYDVPCVWQVWDRQSPPRKKLKTHTTHPLIEFVGPDENADFMLQRVGVAAGRVHQDFTMSPSSHYRIRASDDIKGVLAAANWECKYDTAGNPSVSKNDIIKYLTNL